MCSFAYVAIVAEAEIVAGVIVVLNVTVAVVVDDVVVAVVVDDVVVVVIVVVDDKMVYSYCE